MNVAQVWIYQAKSVVVRNSATWSVNSGAGRTKVGRKYNLRLAKNKDVHKASPKLDEAVNYLFNCENDLARITTDGWHFRTVREPNGELKLAPTPQERDADENVQNEPFQDWLAKQSYEVGKYDNYELGRDIGR